MKNGIRILIVMLCLFSFNEKAVAQPGWDDEPVDTPIDGGLSLLLISAAGLGVYGVRKREKG